MLDILAVAGAPRCRGQPIPTLLMRPTGEIEQARLSWNRVRVVRLATGDLLRGLRLSDNPSTIHNLLHWSSGRRLEHRRYGVNKVDVREHASKAADVTLYDREEVEGWDHYSGHSACIRKDPSVESLVRRKRAVLSFEQC